MTQGVQEVNVVVDPFYSEENMARLRKAIDDLNAGKGTVHEVDYE